MGVRPEDSPTKQKNNSYNSYILSAIWILNTEKKFHTYCNAIKYNKMFLKRLEKLNF